MQEDQPLSQVKRCSSEFRGILLRPYSGGLFSWGDGSGGEFGEAGGDDAAEAGVEAG